MGQDPAIAGHPDPHDEGWLPAVAALSQLLAQFAVPGELAMAGPEITADLRLNLVLDLTMRCVAYGATIDSTATEQRLQAAVRLFLYGMAPAG